MAQFASNVDGVGSKDVVEMMLMTQYFDMLREVGTSQKGQRIFLPHTPGAVPDITRQIRQGFVTAAQVRREGGGRGRDARRE